MIQKKDFPKKHARIKQNWYATEFWSHTGTFRDRQYHNVVRCLDLRQAFGFQKEFGDEIDTSIGYHIDTMKSEPPKFAALMVEHGFYYGDYADPQPKLFHYYATRDEAQAYVDKENAERSSFKEATRYHVIEVDANGYPLKSEIKRLKPILLAEKVELDKEFSKKRKDRERARERREAARA